MSELVEFTRGCLDADEQTARAASPGGWRYGTVESVAGGTLYDETRRIADLTYEQPGDHDGSIVRHLLSEEADANGAHIARHDPARVLAEVNAKRAILDLHDDLLKRELANGDASAYGAELMLSDVLRALAQPYAGEPGWRDEWGTQ